VTDPEMVRAFGRSLRQAVADVTVENRRAGVRLYFDTDAVLPMILGIEGQKFWSSKPREMDLVRALASTELFGPIFMVRAHGFELSRHLQGHDDRVNQDRLTQIVKELLKQSGVTDAVEKLRSLIAESANDEPSQRIEKMIEVLKTYSSDTFVAIERASGHWTQRLSRLYKHVLRFDQMGPEIAELWRDKDEDLVFFQKAIQRHRPSEAVGNDGKSNVRGNLRNNSRNNMMDAAALASLARMVRDSDVTGGPLIRFYTETRPIQELWKTEETFRRRLSHSVDGDGSNVEHGVLRRAEYFLMRVRFPELSPRRGEGAGSLDELNQLLEALQQIDGLADEEFERAVNSLKFKDEPIVAMLEDFKALSLMRAIWHDPSQLAGNLDDFGVGLKDVIDFVNSNLSNKTFGEKIDGIREQLSEQLSQIAQWNRDFTAVREGGVELRKQLVNGQQSSVRDPLRDLGLIRWGLPMDDSDIDWLKEGINALGGSDGDDFELECFKIANSVESARADIHGCMRVASLFWALERYRDAAELVRGAESAGLDVPRGLRLLGVAARLRADSPLSLEEQHLVIGELRAERHKLHGRERGIYDLGFGYVLYFLWKEGKTTRVVPQSELNEIAKECVELGNEAVRLLSEGDQESKLARIYAFNHRAYSAITMGVPGNHWNFIHPLLELKRRVPEIWHARFDDTIGVFYMMRAKAYIDRDVPTGDDLRNAAKSLDSAEGHFNDAKSHNTGGIALDEHVAEWLETMETLRALREPES
jgi:hypothetical protein